MERIEDIMCELEIVLNSVNFNIDPNSVYWFFRLCSLSSKFRCQKFHRRCTPLCLVLICFLKHLLGWRYLKAQMRGDDDCSVNLPLILPLDHFHAFPLTLVGKPNSSRRNSSINENRVDFIGRQWWIFTGQFFCSWLDPLLFFYLLTRHFLSHNPL